MHLARYERYVYLLLELVAMVIAYLFAAIISYGRLDPARQPLIKLLLGCMILLWTIISLIGAFRPMDRRVSRRSILKSLFLSWSGLLFGTLLIDYMLGDGKLHSRFIPVMMGIFLVLAAVVRLGIISAIRAYRARGYNFKRIVLVGSNPVSARFTSEIHAHGEYGYKLVGRFALNAAEQALGAMDLAGFDRFVIDHRVDEVYIASETMDQRVASILRFCAMKNIRVSFLNELIDQLNRADLKVRLDAGGSTMLISLDPIKYRNAMDRAAKRAFDLAFSSLVILLVMSWLFPVVALLIKLTSKGPVLFVQRRTGLLNRPFHCLKFRTMHLNSESDKRQATAGDARITPIGAFLRRSNLDEMPQFFNVLMGHMSVVGPRPHMLAHTDQYAELIDPYMERLWVKPGITGLAQAKGLRGETRELRLMERRVEEDRNYIYHWSFLLDLRIVWATFWNSITLQKQGN